MCLLQGQQVLLMVDLSLQSLQFIIFKFCVIQRNIMKFHTTLLHPSQDMKDHIHTNIVGSIFFLCVLLKYFILGMTR